MELNKRFATSYNSFVTDICNIVWNKTALMIIFRFIVKLATSSDENYVLNPRIKMADFFAFDNTFYLSILVDPSSSSI